MFIGKAEKLHKADMLSQREVEVLRLVAEGRTNQEIADYLFISLNTGKTHVRHIFQCLDARNRAEAISLARVNQLISLSFLNRVKVSIFFLQKFIF